MPKIYYVCYETGFRIQSFNVENTINFTCGHFKFQSISGKGKGEDWKEGETEGGRVGGTNVPPVYQSSNDITTPRVISQEQITQPTSILNGILKYIATVCLYYRLLHNRNLKTNFWKFNDLCQIYNSLIKRCMKPPHFEYIY